MCELGDLDDVTARNKLRSNCGKTKVFRRSGTNYRSQSDMTGYCQGVKKMCELADLDDVAARNKFRSNCGKTKVFRRNGTNYRS